MSDRDELVGTGLGDDALESGWEDLEQASDDTAAVPEAGDEDGPSGPSRARAVAAVTGRAASGLIALGIATVLVGGLSLFPPPTITAQGHSEELTPTAIGRMLVCPSSALVLGNNPTSETLSLSSLGTPNRQVFGSELTVTELEADDVTGQVVPPRSYQRPGGGEETAALAVAQSQRASANRLSGFTATACAPAAHSQWLLGGSTAVGRTTLVLLNNPGEVPASVVLTAYSEYGPAGSSSAITVAPGAQRTVSLASFARDVDAPVVLVTSSGAAVSAFLQHTVQRGLESGGVDLLASAAEPGGEAVIPGIRIEGGQAVLEAASEEGYADLAPLLRMFTTAGEAVEARVQVIGAAGQEYHLDTIVELEPETVAELSLAEVPDGVYTVMVSSPAPLLAGVRVSKLTGAGTASELGWYPAAPQLSGTASVAVASGPAPVLALATPGAAEVTVTGPDGVSTVYSVSSNAATVIPVQPGNYTLSGLQRTGVSVSYLGNSQLAAYAAVADAEAAGAVRVHF